MFIWGSTVSTLFTSNLEMKIKKRLVRPFDSACMYWKLHVKITSKFITQFVCRNLCLVFHRFQLKYVSKLVLDSKKLDNFNLSQTHFIWLFNFTCIPLLKMVRHNNVKIYNAFFRKNCMFYLPPFQYDDIIKSILYSERRGNYELC